MQGEGATVNLRLVRSLGRKWTDVFCSREREAELCFKLSLSLILNYFFFAICLWHSEWHFCCLRFILLVASTSPHFECSCLLFGLETVPASEHIYQQY